MTYALSQAFFTESYLNRPQTDEEALIQTARAAIWKRSTRWC